MKNLGCVRKYDYTIIKKKKEAELIIENKRTYRIKIAMGNDKLTTGCDLVSQRKFFSSIIVLNFIQKIH